MENICHSKYLLFIEPKKEEKSTVPIVDGWIDLIKIAFQKAKIGIAIINHKSTDFINDGRYKGVHVTDCGERSRNYDYLLENELITNSLCKFYLIWYRSSIPECEWEKLRGLARFYNFDTTKLPHGIPTGLSEKE